MKTSAAVIKYLLVFASIMLGFPAIAQDAPVDAKYKACTELAASSPQAGLNYALEWLKTETRPAAYHCKAIALFNVKRYPEAAQDLQALAAKITPAQPALWVSLVKQASKAMKLSGNAVNALSLLTASIAQAEAAGLTSQAGQLLAERSLLYEAAHPLDAVQDLDHALVTTPGNTALLLQRARLFMTMKKNALAKKDVAAVLARDPKNAEAMEIKKLLIK